MSQWNASHCNESGYDFPKFTTSPHAEASIEIAYNWGISPTVTPTGSTVCASVDDESETNVIIRLYQTTRKPDGRILNCPNTAASMGDLIAHELGHYLGLGESNCDDHIMGPMLFQDMGGGQAIYDTWRKVKPAECQAADANNFTRRELCDLGGCGGSGHHGPFHDDPGEGSGGTTGGGTGAACFWKCRDVAGGLTCDLYC